MILSKLLSGLLSCFIPTQTQDPERILRGVITSVFKQVGTVHKFSMAQALEAALAKNRDSKFGIPVGRILEFLEDSAIVQLDPAQSMLLGGTEKAVQTIRAEIEYLRQRMGK